MSGDENEDSQVYNYYLELSKPTEEDFKRVFTDEELKELCLKHKCRVDMWRWNVTNDYRILFTESGRYQRWSDRKRILMLAKAVNKMKPSILYDEEEIKRVRQEEWGLQLKENILSLNYWKRKRLCETREQEQGPHLFVLDSEEIDREIQSQCEVNTESMNVAEINTQSQSQTPSELGDVQRRPGEATKPVLSSQSDGGSILLDDRDADFLIEESSSDSADTVLHNEQFQQTDTVHITLKALETLQSDEVAPEIEDIYGVDTMSMTIGSEISTRSEDIPILQSQDVISPNYDNFKNIIPLTSTQSQTNESEGVQVP